MPFIGIIGKENNSNFIRNGVLKNSFQKFEFVNINKKSIENLKNIKFETIIISDDAENLLDISKYLEEIIKNAKYIIINSDIIGTVINLSNTKVITYGLNRNATITVSSIKKDKFLICLQRQLEDYKKNVIDQQEFNLEISDDNYNKVYNAMAIFTFLLIYGEKLKKI